jgi:hypothetical protein
MCSNSGGRSAWPFPMPCHFARQPRQHVAVACCAMNTGCPLKGVCLPSFRGLASPNRFRSRPSASARTAFRPFLSRYLNSCGRSRKRRRNGDLARSSKSWSMSFVAGLRQSAVRCGALGRRTAKCRQSNPAGSRKRKTSIGSEPHHRPGRSTTLITPSSLSRNFLYIAGASSRLAGCVTTKLGSILPSSISFRSGLV